MRPPGSTLASGSSPQPATPWQNAALFVPLYVVALGTGGIKPNVSAFGADQFDDADPAEAAAKSRYFNAFYFTLNVGALIASLLVVNVQSPLTLVVVALKRWPAREAVNQEAVKRVG